MTFEESGLGDLLRQAQAMQERMAEAQAAAAEQEVEGHAGGGAVRIRVTGNLEFRSVHIDPKAVDPGDVIMLEDLVLAALHDAVDRLNELGQQAVGAGLGDFDFSNLGDALGGLGLTAGLATAEDEDEDDEDDDEDGDDDPDVGEARGGLPGGGGPQTGP